MHAQLRNASLSNFIILVFSEPFCFCSEHPLKDWTKRPSYFVFCSNYMKCRSHCIRHLSKTENFFKNFIKSSCFLNLIHVLGDKHTGFFNSDIQYESKTKVCIKFCWVNFFLYLRSNPGF